MGASYSMHNAKILYINNVFSLENPLNIELPLLKRGLHTPHMCNTKSKLNNTDNLKYEKDSGIALLSVTAYGLRAFLQCAFKDVF